MNNNALSVQASSIDTKILARFHNFLQSAPSIYLIAPGFVAVVDDGGAEAPGGVDAGAGDGDGGQVDQEHGEPDLQRGKDLSMFHTPLSTHSKEIQQGEERR